jgi:hypothetical protein
MEFDLVPGVGVEPTRLSSEDFESTASASSAIRARPEGRLKIQRPLVNAIRRTFPSHYPLRGSPQFSNLWVA